MRHVHVILAALLVAGCGQPSDRLSDEEAAAEQSPAMLDEGNQESEAVAGTSDLPAEYEAACDLLVKIPMAGRADSLNAAVAAAVMVFHLRASWNEAGGRA